MKSTAPVLVAILLVGICSVVAAEVCDYPIDVNTVSISPALKKDVVVIKLANGTNPTLDDFMMTVVPAALRATGALPQPASAPTYATAVTIPGAKNMFIYNANNLPLRLRVKADQKHSTNVSQDSHERFRGRLNDPWSIQSYFVTQFTAVTRVTKYHDSEPYKYPKTVQATGQHRTFDWIDP